METTFLIIAAFLTSTISGMIGMAGGILLISLMTFFLPVHIIIPIHGVAQLASNSSRSWLLRHEISKPILKNFLIGLPFGVLASYFLVREIEFKELFYLFIAALIFWALFKPKRLNIGVVKPVHFIAIGLVTGFLALFVGATGPFLAPFFLQANLRKEELVATKAITQFFTHLLKIPAFIGLGFAYGEYTIEIIGLILATIIGTRTGVHFLKKIKNEQFNKMFKAALLIAAFRLILKFGEAVT